MTRKPKEPKSVKTVKAIVKRDVDGRFQKGSNVNPRGRGIDPLKKALRNLTVQELNDIAGMVVKGTTEDLEAVLKNPQESVLKTMVASVCKKAIQQGNEATMEVLLDRLVGKIPDQIKHSGIPANNSAPAVIFTMPSNNREVKEEKKELSAPTEENKNGDS